jgi:UDP-N-acetylglucosamine 4,6-dehydratase
MSVLASDRVLITGGTGSLGVALAKWLLPRVAHVRIFSRDEKKQYDMRQSLPACEYLLGDVRDFSAVLDAVQGMDVVVHAASLKYIDVGERQPLEYVQTNVVGTMNVLAAALRPTSAVERLRHVVGISTDKAPVPVNVYGITKFLLERLFLEAHARRRPPGSPMRFTVARYGNVLGTRGSVIPFWAAKRKINERLPITNPWMTRFFFSLEDAVRLIEVALTVKSGLIVSQRMSAATMHDLAEVMQTAGTVVVGERAGEKLHELLLTESEMARVQRSGDVFVLDPEAAPTNGGLEAYTSDRAPRLSQGELRALLEREGWL